MISDPLQRHRHSIRLKGYEYTQPGAYFVTLVTQDRACLFGEIAAGEMRINRIGSIVARCWRDIPTHFSGASLDEFVIMPNHLHGIILIQDCTDILSDHQLQSAIVDASPQLYESGRKYRLHEMEATA